MPYSINPPDDITYTWRITGLHVANPESIDDAVARVQWQKVYTDPNGIEGYFEGSTTFDDFEDMDPADFVPFDELTEEIVLSWVKPLVVGDYEEHVDEQVWNHYQRKVKVVKQKPMPWGDGTDKDPDDDVPDVGE